MLSLFPIQFLALFAYFILRVVTGFLLVRIGQRVLFTSPRPRGWLPFSVTALGVGFLLLIGLYTQAAALIAILLSISVLLARSSTLTTLLPDSYFWILLIGIGISIFITGAGIFAIDLPI